MNNFLRPCGSAEYMQIPPALWPRKGGTRCSKWQAVVEA